MGLQRVGHDWATFTFIHLLPPSHPHPTLLGHHRGPTELPCHTAASRWLLYTWQCMNVSPTLCPPAPSPAATCPQVSSLRSRLYSCPANRFISTIFLDSISSVQSPSRVRLFATPWTAGFPVHHHLPEFTQTHVHWIGDTIQPAHSLPSPSSSAFDLSQHQGLFQWVSSSHQVAKVLEL